MIRIARTLVVTLAALTIAGTASAQMGGHGAGNGTGTGTGTGTHAGTGPAGMPGGPGFGPGAGGVLLVAPDGTTVVVAHEPSTTAGTPGTSQLIAVAPNGSVVWRFSAQGAIPDAVLAGSLVVAAVETVTPAADAATAPTVDASVVGLSLATGAQAWSTAVTGSVQALEAASDGVRALLVERVAAADGTGSAAAGAGGAQAGTGARTLASFNLSGALLWQVALAVE